MSSITLEECPLCVVLYPKNEMIFGASCMHLVCHACMKKYITNEINHSRLNIACPVCAFHIHPNNIKKILQDEELYLKYENFMLRRVVAAEPDARWCPAPDCGYVVIASGCASCPELKCGRKGCNTSFCYHCKQLWHPDETCRDAKERRDGHERNFDTMTLFSEFLTKNSPARRIYSEVEFATRSSSAALQQQQTASSSSTSTTTTATTAAQIVDEIRECPVCGSRIIKMNDGSCNHMKCSICETEFCWLCMKEITELHYFSPSGCTFWGKRPWSRKKKIFWQLGMLVGAPVCIMLVAGVAIPAIVIGIPVWAGRKLRDRLERQQLSRYRKNAIITGGVLASLLVSPLISAVTLAVGIPIILGYVYGVVPISLCRSGGCCLSSFESVENLHQASVAFASRSQRNSANNEPTSKQKSSLISKKNCSTSSQQQQQQQQPKVSNTSTADSQTNSPIKCDISNNIETSSNNEDSHSTRALAGSIYKEPDFTLVEVHNK